MNANDTATIQSGELGLSEAAGEHAARVHEHLGALIAAEGGSISFERYMQEALYAPGLGYYSGGAIKLGADGDFITAPEVSRLFGACLAVQCAEILKPLNEGVILEIGAGTGRLAVDVLSRLDGLHQLPREYLILEVSADLRERQKKLIEQSVPQLIERVRWLDAPPRESFEGILIANEVLDALPVARFRVEEQGLKEFYVRLQDERFQWVLQPARAALKEAYAKLEEAGCGFSAGYESECCLRLEALTFSLTQSLAKGAALFIDYGLPRAQYYLPERDRGTLMCHFRHRAHPDPLICPGLQDITAWVDFTRLAEASRAAGFELAGFTTQAHFLAGCGIDNEMRRLAGDNHNVFARLASQARQLMLPGEMGERFKAMAWLKGLELALCGFAVRDLRHSL
ncbi:MAG TPA: SAM-dependent methyltransferase [Steroidobacteraceae bacterium]|jgi:SAM-dependent MidA family methyltransferase